MSLTASKNAYGRRIFPVRFREDKRHTERLASGTLGARVTESCERRTLVTRVPVRVLLERERH
jgi:hypothetical protein